MSKYRELVEQIESLREEAERVRQAEKAEAIARVKAIMREYGIKPNEIGVVPRRRGRPRVNGEAKYMDPISGATWTGKGRKPGWLVEALKAGTPIEQFRV